MIQGAHSDLPRSEHICSARALMMLPRFSPPLPERQSYPGWRLKNRSSEKGREVDRPRTRLDRIVAIEILRRRLPTTIDKEVKAI